MARSEFDIREPQQAGLTPNARVCLLAEGICDEQMLCYCISYFLFKNNKRRLTAIST